MFTSKCALPHNGVHIFDISTSNSGPILVCFCTCSLPNVLCPTTACAFSTFQLPKVVREWCALTLFTSQCASHHNSMQFLICPDVSAPAAKPTFRPSGATKHWKKQWFGTFLLFCAPASSLFWLSPYLIFPLLIFALFELLRGCAFPSVHIVGSLASKLPSIIHVSFLFFRWYCAMLYSYNPDCLKRWIDSFLTHKTIIIMFCVWNTSMMWCLPTHRNVQDVRIQCHADEL